MYAVAAVSVGLGMITGLVTGGRFSNLGRRWFRFVPLLVIGVALQIVVVAVHLSRRPDQIVVLASYSALAAFAGANLHLGGMGVVAIGLGLNIVPIAVNQGMPVRVSAIIKAGIASNAEDVAKLGLGGKRHMETSHDRVRVLGDILPDWVFHEVLSFGDLTMSIGIAAVVANLMRPSCRRRLDGRSTIRFAPPHHPSRGTPLEVAVGKPPSYSWAVSRRAAG